jgi:hypothetical protein
MQLTYWKCITGASILGLLLSGACWLAVNRDVVAHKWNPLPSFEYKANTGNGPGFRGAKTEVVP